MKKIELQKPCGVVINKKLLILSGKGGTGKTTTAAAFIDFSQTKGFVDCDVDAPNLHLVAGIKTDPEKRNFYGSEKAVINPDKCVGCGVCYKNCRFGAKLKMGQGTSGKLVTEVKNQLDGAVNKGEFVIIDGSPGIGCPVIASISGVDMVLIVAEPSLSGISDMKRILRTAEIFQTKTAVCVNKFNTCIENTEEIKQLCLKEGIPFVGRIPYDKQASMAINAGHSLARINTFRC